MNYLLIAINKYVEKNKKTLHEYPIINIKTEFQKCLHDLHECNYELTSPEFKCSINGGYFPSIGFKRSNLRAIYNILNAYSSTVYELEVFDYLN